MWSHLCDGLDLQPAIRTASKQMAVKLEICPEFANHSPQDIAAVSIYVSSYMGGSPKSHVAIAGLAGFGARFLLDTYELVYPIREQLLDGTMGGVVLPAPRRFGEPPF